MQAIHALETCQNTLQGRILTAPLTTTPLAYSPEAYVAKSIPHNSILQYIAKSLDTSKAQSGILQQSA